MKKVLTLVCALALVAGASAQVRQAGEVLKPQSSFQKQMSSFIDKSKATGDSMVLGTQWLHENERFSFSPGAILLKGGIMNYYTPGGNPSIDIMASLGNVDAYWFFLSSAYISYQYGSGELGYSFDFRNHGWYESYLGEPVKDMGVTAAYTLMGRIRSSNAAMNNKKMPLRLKLYTSNLGQVTEQTAYETINEEDSRTQRVYYPADPEKYVSLTAVDSVPYLPIDASDPKAYFLEYDWYGGKFETPAIAGENVCLSVLFPRTGTAEDTLWNACVFEGYDASSNTLVSERAAAMYAVYDFENQHNWSYGENDYVRERVEGFLPDSNQQPNKRYAIVPKSAHSFSDGTPDDGEVIFRIVVTEGVAIERGAAYDKYVEVKYNPAIDYTVLVAADKINRVEIYNMNGGLVKTQACNENEVTVRLDGLASGMYVAKVITDGGIASKKIMVR